MYSNIPKNLHFFLESQSSQDQQAILAGWSAQRFQCFRVNTLKIQPYEVESLLSDLKIPFYKHPQSSAYFFDTERLYAFRGSPLFRTGLTYLQGASSQIPAELLRLKKDMRVLDACAAPGGKTTQISALMQNTGEIVAFEMNQIRYDTLLHTIQLQGAENITPEKTHAKKWCLNLEDASFDRILLDVPCSALWRISLAKEASYAFVKPETIAYNRSLQEEIVTAALPKLAPGWILAYSTCTLTFEENESMKDYILQSDPSLTCIEEKKIFPDAYFEGFYVAIFQKN